MSNQKFSSQKVNTPTAREEKVFWNLKRYGSPLSKSGVSGLNLTLEETLVEALALSRRFAYVAQVWPVLFALNAEDVDMDELEALARKKGYGAVLGFFLSVVRGLTQDPNPMEVELRLLDTRPRNPEMFFLVEHSPMMVELAEHRSPDQARDWNFRMVTPLLGFQETFDTFVR